MVAEAGGSTTKLNIHDTWQRKATATAADEEVRVNKMRTKKRKKKISTMKKHKMLCCEQFDKNVAGNDCWYRGWLSHWMLMCAAAKSSYRNNGKSNDTE